MDRLNRIQQILSGLKCADDFKGIPRLPVRQHDRIVAYLRPVPSVRTGISSDDASLMSEWRNAQKMQFFTWLTVTKESTEKWLAGTYNKDHLDIITMVETIDGLPFGHLSLYDFRKDGVCEFGRILRGPGCGPKGGMTLASCELLRWATAKLQVNKVFLEVFEHNLHAIDFYRRIGFTNAGHVPLTRIESSGVTRWEKVPDYAVHEVSADGYALRMEATAEQIRAAHHHNCSGSVGDFCVDAFDLD
jgi:RimJ/RimL family protein N-acetyltransferase